MLEKHSQKEFYDVGIKEIHKVVLAIPYKLIRENQLLQKQNTIKEFFLASEMAFFLYFTVNLILQTDYKDLYKEELRTINVYLGAEFNRFYIDKMCRDFKYSRKIIENRITMYENKDFEMCDFILKNLYGNDIDFKDFIMPEKEENMRICPCGESLSMLLPIAPILYVEAFSIINSIVKK